MYKKALEYNSVIILLISALMISGCQQGSDKDASSSNASNGQEIKLITLAPAHFHAALVQKIMYPGIDSVVHVYAPKGLGLNRAKDLARGRSRRRCAAASSVRRPASSPPSAAAHRRPARRGSPARTPRSRQT